MPANKLLLSLPGAMGSRYKSLSTGRRLRARKSSPFSSSVISASRAGESLSGARRRRISDFQSGIFCLRDAIDARDKFAPAAKLRCEDFPSLASHTIMTAATLSTFFNPAPMQPAASFQAVEHRVKRGHMEAHCAARALLDEFADLVAVARARFDERKNEQFGAASFPFRL